MDIYNRISDLLKSKKKTRLELANDTKISYNTLTSLFSRRSKQMNIDTLVLIADYLDVSVDYLVTGKNKIRLKEDDLSLTYNANDLNMSNELVRVYNTLPLKDKTLILAKAYELSDNNKK